MPTAGDLDWYASQSAVTSPGESDSLLADLPASIDELRRIAHGLVIHYRVEDPVQAGIPPARLAEIDTRYGEKMLARLCELKDGPLAGSRAPTQRLVGCCRDFTVLLLAMARSAGMPARGRVGFARYFIPGFGLDHEVAEVWDEDRQRWRLVDAELDEQHIDPTDGQPLYPLDLPRDRFLVAGAAWQLCGQDAADPATFLVDPAVDVEGTRGWPYLQHNLIHDLAALNKMEMLLWDGWELADGHSTGPRDLELLDRIATATNSPDPPVHDVRTLYHADSRLPVPTTITSYDPLGGPLREVALAASRRPET